MLGSLYDDEFYENQVAGSLTSARLFLAHLMQYVQPKSVLDVGCGRGAWLKACHELGSSILLGLDGDWNSQSKMMDSSIVFKSIDLNGPFAIDHKADLAMTLEVAEHLAPSSSSRFVECLANASDAVLFSAAYPGQGGSNHINEQPHSYWAGLFRDNGYVPFDLFRPVFWGDPRVACWYRQNAFLYLNKDSSVYERLRAVGLSELANIQFMNCVHPELYEAKCRPLSFNSHIKDLIPSFFRSIRSRLRTHR